jgi:quercetin dioxygenase-like cupin family protein
VAIIFNESTILADSIGEGAQRQCLLTAERVPGTAIRLDRLTLWPGAILHLDVSPNELAWFQTLEGEVQLAHGRGSKLSEAHVAFLPPGFRAALSTTRGAVLLYAAIRGAVHFDPALAHESPCFRMVDWTREPVLHSKHDARRRIYLVTPKLFGTKAIKGEMIIYPPRTTGANHHHEGAEHFMYILRGHGTVYANEKPFPVRKGDVVFYADRERHFLAAADEEMCFAEFFVPGEFRTVWVDETEVCTWLPTGRDIRGRVPMRDIAAHSIAEPTHQDV